MARALMAVLYQSTVMTASNIGAVIDAIHVDEDTISAPDLGQWDLER